MTSLEMITKYEGELLYQEMIFSKLFSEEEKKIITENKELSQKLVKYIIYKTIINMENKYGEEY